MTYHAGIGLGMAVLGFRPREPHVTCDGCGMVASGVTRDGWPTAWLRNGTAPPGWRLTRREDGTSDHRCKACLVAT